jgi:integrase
MKMPARYVPRQRVLTDEELRQVWLTAENAGYPFGTIVRLLILTGQRTGEINSLRFEFIDGDNLTITFPETKNGRLHTVPYGPLLMRVLKEVPQKSRYLFPGRDPAKPYNGGGKQKFLFDKQCIIAPWTLHDLRRTFATNMARLGVAPHIVERLLNHSSGTISGIAAIYNRFQYLDEMLEAMTAWERYLKRLLKPSKGKRSLSIAR